jgi:hypothetical protein
LNAVRSQQFDELSDRPRRVADGEDRHSAWSGHDVTDDQREFAGGRTLAAPVLDRWFAYRSTTRRD